MQSFSSSSLPRFLSTTFQVSLKPLRVYAFRRCIRWILLALDLLDLQLAIFYFLLGPEITDTDMAQLAIPSSLDGANSCT